MAAVRGVLGWLGRRGIVFVALVSAILIYWSATFPFEGFHQLRKTAVALTNGEGELLRHFKEGVNQSDARVAGFHRLSRGQISGRIDAARRDRAPMVEACGSDLGALVTTGAAGVIENRKRCLEATLLAREIDTLTAMRRSLDARVPGETVPHAVRRHAASIRRAAAIIRDAGGKLKTLDADYVPDILQRSEMQRQRVRIVGAESFSNAAKRNADILTATQTGIGGASQAATKALAEAHQQYRTLLDERAKALSDNIIQKAQAWAETNNLLGAMKRAAGALALIIATPFLIRLFCYYVLAPAAMRRPPIRLRAPFRAGITISPAERSTTSIAVRLNADEELLVRQDYLQTTSHSGDKDTQWLLDWRHPITSIATGLAFLTRIRGDGEITTVSAVRDPFAEVTIVTLPEGAACVLQPRALAAVAQPIHRRLRAKTEWRLLSLNAWLTMQLRYVIFEGPARMVVKGGRGVRVERAEAGRVFGQDQLVGFSADLAYSVTRTETFAPYFFGREPLLKDRVEAGGGVLIVEEAPGASSRAREARHGIEGLIDAGMKVFGM